MYTVAREFVSIRTELFLAKGWGIPLSFTSSTHTIVPKASSLQTREFSIFIFFKRRIIAGLLNAYRSTNRAGSLTRMIQKQYLDFSQTISAWQPSKVTPLLGYI